MRHQPPPLQPDANGDPQNNVQATLRDAFTAEAVATPDFRAGVWARIDARRNPATWPQWLRSHAAGVTAATAICVLLATSLGGWLAYEQNRSQRQQQIILYLSSIDAHQRLATQADAQSSVFSQ